MYAYIICYIIYVTSVQIEGNIFRVMCVWGGSCCTWTETESTHGSEYACCSPTRCVQFTEDSWWMFSQPHPNCERQNSVK